MAESTFSRKIEIRDESSMEKLRQVLKSDAPARKLTKPVYSEEERKKSRLLLESCGKQRQ